MSVKMFHNPRCSKSRQTLEILTSNGVEPELVEYLNDVPTRETLEQVLDMLKMQPRDLMRKREAAYSENNLADESLSREQLIDAMIANPILIERPIVITNGKAAIGRPPESVLEIL